MVSDGSEPHILYLNGSEVPLSVRRNRRARHLTLHVDHASGAVCLVLPRRAALSEGLAFAEERAEWLRRQLEALPPRQPFRVGGRVPILGDDHVIRHDPDSRRGVWRENGAIQVSGFVEHVPRRVADYLKREARSELTTRAHAKAKTVNRTIAGVTLRDTKSRWGSCSSDRRLNFSWRLILAPEIVLDYVVAHEVAHLVHMNHGPRFWSLVGRLTDDVAGARIWLRDQGHGLHRYG